MSNNASDFYRDKFQKALGDVSVTQWRDERHVASLEGYFTVGGVSSPLLTMGETTYTAMQNLFHLASRAARTPRQVRLNEDTVSRVYNEQGKEIVFDKQKRTFMLAYKR